LVNTRKDESKDTEKTNLRKIIATGLKCSLAILNQMNEKAQKVIARITAPYILIEVFNFIIVDN
jgi:hypothetical protein